ncbi:MAG: N,N-dimethylformamidase beta subunit family domain-containing protein [Acidimicrobiales bacterium]
MPTPDDDQHGAPTPSSRPGGPRHARRPDPERRTLDRRTFLLGGLGVAGLAGLAIGIEEATTSGQGATPGVTSVRDRSGGHGHEAAKEAVTTKKVASGVEVPVARWLVEENAKKGTLDWVVTGQQVPHAIEGFASQVSAVPGEDVTLFVNTAAKSVMAQVFRMGYYQGLGGRMIDQSASAPGQQQPAPTITGGVHTVSCPWQPTLTLHVTATWPPGCYLVKIVGTGGQQQYVPITIRDDKSRAAYVLQNSVTTWQAYNRWGGYSLYYGPTPSGGASFADRARIVSFDRPYPQTWAQGSADFFGKEFPVLYQLESYGCDLTYWTDVDLHARPQLLLDHKCLFSMGHDEYWSKAMRDGALQAVAKGVNMAFLGANACYRQIRLQPSAVGPNRLQVCYKDAGADPMYGVHNTVVTGPSWESPPTNWPESQLIGDMYQSIGATDDLVITDASAWLFDGCGFHDGQHLPGVVQGEYDRYVPSLPGPKNVDVLAHSPVTKQSNWSDITYYTSPGGGGVAAMGMASFVNKLSNTTAFPWNIVPKAIPGVTEPLLRAMDNLYGAFGFGPAAKRQAATGNWTSVYTGTAATATPATAPPSA